MLCYEKERSVVNPKSVLRGIAKTADGAKDLMDLGFTKSTFDYPKPVSLLKYFVDLVTEPGEGDVILDFFAGSCTLGQAVMQANAEDQGNRRFVCVQLPEPVEPPLELADGTQANDLATISAERLQRSGKKIAGGIGEDFGGRRGFRHYSLDTSNIRPWEADPDDIEGTLFAHIEHIKPDRAEQDVVTELLLKLGLDLCTPMQTREIAGKTVRAVGAGSLFTCLADRVAGSGVEALAQGIVAWRNELDPIGDTTVVFRDSAFEDDIAKANAAAILEQHGIKTVRSL